MLALKQLIHIGLPLASVLSVGLAQANPLFVDYSQPYDNGLLSGMFTGFDNNTDGIITSDELISFSQEFKDNGSNLLFSQFITDLNNFVYDIGSNTIEQIASSSTQEINDGTTNSIQYDVNAFGSSQQSSVNIITNLSDGTTTSIDFLSNSPIESTVDKRIIYDFSQDYNGSLLIGMFEGEDVNGNGFLTLNELTRFGLSFEDTIINSVFKQDLEDLLDFNFNIGAKDIEYFVSESTEEINDGVIDNILYSVNAVNDPNLDSLVSITTNFADGTSDVSENFTNSPIEVQDPIGPISTPEPNTLSSLLIVGGAVASWKRLRK